MSRFSVFVHQHFGTDPNQSVADILIKFLPDTGTLGQVKEIVSDAVAVMEGTGLTGDQKKMLVTAVVNFALQAAHINIPAAVVSYLIEEAVLLLKGGQKSQPPVPVQPPVTSIYGNPANLPIPDDHTLLTMGFKSGDAKYASATQWQVVNAGTVLGGDWKFVAFIGA